MRYTLILLVLLVGIFGHAQPDSLFLKPKISNKISLVPVWSKENKATLDFSQVAFVNWNSGGSNSISALLGVAISRNLRVKHSKWNNTLVARYGINKQQDQRLRKTDDIFEIVSNFGYRKDTLTNWYFSARFNFKTQFTNGFNYPDTSNPISRLMAPGYLFLGAGVEYGKNIEKFSLYFSPFTLKTTFVLDEDLANQGAFGVEPAVYDDEGNIIQNGERIREELGILFTGSHEIIIMENIKVINLFSVYTDYLNNFGNIDIDWALNVDFKVNEFIRATLGSHLRYDDDVKILKPVEGEEDEFVETGPKVQWKQLLGIGVVVNF